MTMFTKILIGSAGLAAIAVGTTPAAAQPAPYGSYNQGYNQSGVVGAVINSVLGGGRYGAYGQGQDRVGVDQCARAAEARVSNDYRAGRYGYNQGYDNRGYGNRAMANARVIGITRVERRSAGLRVSGVMDSGLGYGNQGYDPRYNQGYDPRYNQGYGNQGYDPRYADPRYNQGYNGQAYGYNTQSADLRFDCRVDYRGRVTSLDIKHNNRRGI